MNTRGSTAIQSTFETVRQNVVDQFRLSIKETKMDFRVSLIYRKETGWPLDPEGNPNYCRRLCLSTNEPINQLLLLEHSNTEKAV